MKDNSLLFIPAKEKTLKKVGLLEADIYILDLEDSIEEDNKEKSLHDVKNFLETNSCFENIFVRLNKYRFEYETEILCKFNIGFMLPKFELVEEYNSCSEIWEKHPVIALVESPKGIVYLSEIASCSWIDGIAFGAEDYTANVNMDNHFSRLIYQKEAIVTNGKAFGKKVYDTPSFEINNENILIQEIEDSRANGFDGKLAIHPKKVNLINKVFKTFDIENLKKIVSEYETKGEAVLLIDGRPYEKMHINRFKRIIKENGGF